MAKRRNLFKSIFLSVGCVPAILGLLAASVKSIDSSRISKFDKAVDIIKKYETIHQPRHWPFVGYGHRVLRGEKFNRRKPLSEAEADALLRKDLKANCAVFREFGADSLLLGVLAYNIGRGATMRSSLTKMLREGNRDIRDVYVSYSRYRGKQRDGIRRRRIEEYEALYDMLPHTGDAVNDDIPDLPVYDPSSTPLIAATDNTRERFNNL